jgi:hypothetical protein
MSPVSDHASQSSASAAARLTRLMHRLNGLCALVPQDLVSLAARFFPAVVFWQSARTKVDGFSIKDSTYFLFENVYDLPLIPPSPLPCWRRWPNISCRCCWCSASSRGSRRWGCWP